MHQHDFKFQLKLSYEHYICKAVAETSKSIMRDTDRYDSFILVINN